jgi:hypothetical protein
VKARRAGTAAAGTKFLGGTDVATESHLPKKDGSHDIEQF